MVKPKADAHRKSDGWRVAKTAAGHFRRIVPSPLPIAIGEMSAIRTLVSEKHIVICGGGGGIPVTQDASGALHGAAAVIDKDRTSGLLATALNAKLLVILTAVECAYVNYGQPNQQPIANLTTNEARAHLAAGEFGNGSMRPKIETAVSFVEASHHEDAAVVIAHIDNFIEALHGKSGTRVVR